MEEASAKCDEGETVQRDRISANIGGDRDEADSRDRKHSQEKGAKVSLFDVRSPEVFAGREGREAVRWALLEKGTNFNDHNWGGGKGRTERKKVGGPGDAILPHCSAFPLGKRREKRIALIADKPIVSMLSLGIYAVEIRGVCRGTGEKEWSLRLTYRHRREGKGKKKPEP